VADRSATRGRAGHGGAVRAAREVGIGKSALLETYGQAARLLRLRVAGVESEMELDYAGLQQLCGPFTAAWQTCPLFIGTL